MYSYVSRLRARVQATPTQRLRRILIGIYLLTAAADAGGKALAANPAVNRAVSSRVSGASAVEMREASRPSGNFEIFRTASRHLMQGLDLYAEYPAEHSDRFKYSPAFALLFAPLAWLVWPLALFLWSALNAFALFFAVERVLPARAALLAMALLHLEVLRAMQNAQSNALVAALIVFAFAELEKRSAWRGAAAVALGACVKIFPIAALTFALPRRLAIRAGAWAAAIGAALVALPLLVTSPATLAMQYRSWQGVESLDATARWFSVMELLHRTLRVDWPNWPLQAIGTAVLLAPILLRRAQWDDARFRLLYLCSLLMYVVLFNHQAERASFLIAFVGITIWYAAEPRTRSRTALFLLAFVTITLMSTLIPVSADFKSKTGMLYRLALPTLAVWLAVQRQLWRSRAGAAATPAPAWP